MAELCEKTGYDPDEIEPEFELEADLGVDTVKQAEIMAAVREHFHQSNFSSNIAIIGALVRVVDRD